MADCLFCKIIRGEIPCIKLLETDKALAFMDIFPTSEGHCLVIPKECREKLHQLSSESMAGVGAVLPKLAAAVGAENYNLLQNNGALAHQEVKHVHFHLIPKTSEEDGLGVTWPSKKGDMDKLNEIAEGIRTRLEHAE